ncbi:MAG TPA: sugar phosphate isomerase/epimerase family protein [Planctomycetota bacterium]|nr:sugar phosphate isomerase/epimerase family protein [Planctomycetota bacterium]
MKLSLFSVSYAGLWGQARLDLEAFLHKAKALGYDGVELMGKRPHLSPLDVAPERAAELGRQAKGLGLEVACVAAYTNFTAGLESTEVPLGDIQVQYVESLARLAAELGCRLVRVFTGYESPRAPLPRLWAACVDGLRACCDRTAPLGVTIGVQNHHDLGVHTDAFLELLGDVGRPNCKAMFDAWSPALRGEDLYAAARKAAPHTVYTTAADYVRLPRFQYQPDLVNYAPAEPPIVRAVPMGDGFVDYPAFFRGLRDGGYDGWAAYEMCSPLRGGGSIETLDACARRFIEYMRRLA